MSISLHDFINPDYLAASKLHELYIQFLKTQPNQYLILDNFLREDIYRKILQEFSASKEVFLDQYSQGYINNKTIFKGGSTLKQIYEFFNSQQFIDFMKIFYGKIIRRGHILPLETLGLENFGIHTEGAIFQLYTDGDFMSWHTDLPKDMERDEKVAKGGFELWHNYNVDKYEEIGAFVYYIFNSESNQWKKEYGGVFEFGEFKNNSIEPYVHILPDFNRFILFKSTNTSYHRVTKIEGNYKRYTIQDMIRKP